jgi:putative toxin-antitoxin system antitoxin component (TIGR02293 family)
MHPVPLSCNRATPVLYSATDDRKLSMKQKSGAPGGSKLRDEPQTASTGATFVLDTAEIDILRSFELLQGQVADLLGGTAVIGRLGRDPLAAHFLLEAGIPNRAIEHLAHSLKVMGQESLEQAIGMSSRTLQRKEKKPRELLSHEQAGRAWQFAELLAKATVVFGAQDEAEQWFERPAIGLNQKRPIDLLTTPAGVKVVEDHLERLAYGVYA